jgi:hypothetical protein
MFNKVQFDGQGGQAGQPVQPATPPVQPDATQQSPQAGAQPPAPDGFTPAQLAQLSELIKTNLALTTEELRRKQQSETAKAEKRIKDTVQQQLAVMRDAGMQVAPDTERAVENIVRKQMTQAETQPEQAAAQPQPQPQPGEQPVSALDAAAFAIMDAMGVDLEPEDPEVTTLDRSTPQAYLTSMAKALTAKAARVQTPPSARLPAGSGGGPAPTKLPDDPDELFKMARAQALKGR